MTTNAEVPAISDEQIAQRAYEIWEARGCPDGDGTENWEAAVAELQDEACQSAAEPNSPQGRGFIARCLGRLRKAG